MFGDSLSLEKFFSEFILNIKRKLSHIGRKLRLHSKNPVSKFTDDSFFLYLTERKRSFVCLVDIRRWRSLLSLWLSCCKTNVFNLLLSIYLSTSNSLYLRGKRSLRNLNKREYVKEKRRVEIYMWQYFCFVPTIFLQILLSLYCTIE